MGAPALPISIDDVRAASVRLRGVAQRTPVMRSHTADTIAGDGRQLLFKCENFQTIGAFKLRGAYNAIVQLDTAVRASGVAAASSGNHAQAVALAARMLGAPAVICMPHDAPAAKRAATEGYGARVVEFDRATTRPEDAVAEVAQREGLTVIPAFDHPHVMAGQGTLALELFEDAGLLDALVVPLGGGGLLSGCATVAKALNPACRVVGVETEGADDWVQSLARGERVLIDPPTTIADGIRTRQPGVHTFEQVRAFVDDVVLVSDAEVLEAMRFMVLRMKLVVEPPGAVAAAAALPGRAGIPAGASAGIGVSGGNVDASLLARILDTR